jgi:hypothetical protein
MLTYLVLGVLYGVLANKLQFRQLEKLFCVGYAIEHLSEIGKSFVMTDGHEGGKGISLARRIVFLQEEVVYKIRRIRDQLLEVLVYGGDREHGVLPHVGVAVLEALSCGLQQGLHELGLTDFAEEAKGVAANVFVGMLQIQSNSVTADGVLLRASCTNASNMAYHTRIISCLSFPLASCLGQTS